MKKVNVKCLLTLPLKYCTLNLTLYQQEYFKYKNIQSLDKEPINLYQPITYILGLKGKKIRPILTLMAAHLFSEEYLNALPVAYAIEMFHNFTLVHDDIMDDAPLRRGKETVHEKWDINTGILSGDAMLILTYKHLEIYSPATFHKLCKTLSRTAIEVCEGQQLDIDFETRTDVTINEYITMISLKTSVLIGAALQMGAIVSNATEQNAQKLYDFGLNLGIAFQLQDDYLDTFGDPEKFGKQVGGDIIENKKTFLYLRTRELATPNDLIILEKLFASKQTIENKLKIESVKQLFNKYNISHFVKEQIDFYTNKAFIVLDDMNISEQKKDELKSFGTELMRRNV